jgi:predicted nucleotidyltransferase
MVPDEVVAAAANHPYPLVFSTVSGSHLYGFSSPDSDWDLRGAHILSLDQILGLREAEETSENSSKIGLEIDLVTHDVKKFITLLLKPNGYVLEQLLSPIVVTSSPGYEELKSLAPGCITRFHVHHYLGFANNQWKMFTKEPVRRVKPLLYAFRVVLTGIHLMRSGELEPNLRALNELYPIAFIPELIQRKALGAENVTIGDESIDHYEKEFLSLLARLEFEGEKTFLGNKPTVRDQLNDLLIRVRLGTQNQSPML